MKIKRLKGASSFNELLLTLAALGILITTAWMNYDRVLAWVKSFEAKTQLNGISGLQTQYYYMNSKYSMDFNDILFVPPKTELDGGTAKYRYEILEASNTSFRARATAVIDFNGDGQFNVWEINQDGKPIEIVTD